MSTDWTTTSSVAGAGASANGPPGVAAPAASALSAASAAAASDWSASGSVHEDAAKAAAQRAAKKVDGKAGVFMASFNLSNVILGAGVGGMPYALKEAGFWSGLILLCVVGASADFSVRTLIKLAQKVNKKHYEQLVQSQFGKAGYIAVSIAMGIFAYGAMTAYLIGIGDTMSIVFASVTGVDLVAKPWVKRVVLVAIAVGAVLPLALLKNMAALTKTSLLSIISVMFITFVVVVRLFSQPADMILPVGSQRDLKFIDINFFPAIGIISFAFVCHHACFMVYNTLRDNTDARWNRTVHTSIGVALGIMLILASSAYLTFRDIMNSNFLTNYSYHDGLVNMMRVMFALTQTLTYPLELFVARHCIHALFFASEKKFSDQLHYGITLLLWSSSLAIALNVTELGVVLELTGGVSAVFIGFVMPAMLMFKMSEFNWRLLANPPEKRAACVRALAPAVWLLVFGILAMIFTLVFVGAQLAAGGHGPHDAFDNAHGDNHAAAVGNVTNDDAWAPGWNN